MKSGKGFVSKQVSFFAAVATLMMGQAAYCETFCDRFYFNRPQLAAQEIVRAVSQTPGYRVADGRATASDANTPAPAKSQELDKDFLARLNGHAKDNATKCRYAAQFMGGRWTCGNSSKGMCAQGTRETLNQMKIPMPRGNAVDQQAFLNNPKYFEKLAEQKISRGQPVRGTSRINQNLCNSGDPGIVCLYTTTRHNYGHIEVKSAPGRFCSDFCSTHASNLNGKGKFTLVGVYRIKKP